MSRIILSERGLKTLTYGVMHFVVAVTVAFALTGSLVIALSVGIVEPMVQTVAYTLHEGAWARRSQARNGARKKIRSADATAPAEDPCSDGGLRHFGHAHAAA